MSPFQPELKHSTIDLALVFSFAPSPGPFLFMAWHLPLYPPSLVFLSSFFAYLLISKHFEL